MFRTRQHLRALFLFAALAIGSVFLLWHLRGEVWTRYDASLLDQVQRLALQWQQAPPASDEIIYIVIDDTTYDRLGSNVLSRELLAELNLALAELDPEAVAYDIIFARPAHPREDSLFAASIRQLNRVYLPAAFDLGDGEAGFGWQGGPAYQRLRDEFLKLPQLSGTSAAPAARRGLLQADSFYVASRGSGHISTRADNDGVFRHVYTLVAVDSAYLPALPLAMFLDYADVSADEIQVHWRQQLRIPASPESFIDDDVIIPIDAAGRAALPFPNVWGEDFPQIPLHKFLHYVAHPDLRGNLLDLIEGKFVFVGDVSTGIADLGRTPLEDDVPLVALNAAALNGLLTGKFYQKWTRERVAQLFILVAVLLLLVASLRSSQLLYAAGFAVPVALAWLTWAELMQLRLLPVASLLLSGGAVFFALIAALQITVQRERAFIRSAFARYVPERVVHQMLAQPETLQLGGEERELTVLFSDLAGFTALAEQMSPADVADFLNTYFSEMADIIRSEEGIVDKFMGDAIMAEFGIPLALPQHADNAVRAALRMQARVTELRAQPGGKFEDLACRIGINSGSAIAGNMGSRELFDYTVFGDEVNIAARLESANKRYATGIMISGHTRTLLTPNAFKMRLLDFVRLKGKTRPVKVYEVYGDENSAIEAHLLDYYYFYEEAFLCYLGKDFDHARRLFQKALDLKQNDPATTMMLARLDGLGQLDLLDSWTGAVTLGPHAA